MLKTRTLSTYRCRKFLKGSAIVYELNYVKPLMATIDTVLGLF